jgi:hypothetical protein
LKWTYAKNGSVDSGEDKAWVDQVLFGPVAPTISSEPTDQDIDEGGTARFNVVAAGTPPFTYQWELDSPQYGFVLLENCCGISGATSANLVITNADLTYAGIYRVRVSSAAGTTVSAGADLNVFPILPLDIALDTPGLTWTTNGTPPWTGHGAINHDGAHAARSGYIGNNGSNSMSTVFNGAGTVSFWWKVSSQPNSDYLSFFTNGRLAVRISGDLPWEFKSFDLGPGNNLLTWAYTKNGSTSNFQDRAWVDQVKFGVVAPTIITQPANTTVAVGDNATFTVVAAATPPIYYQWQFNGAPLTEGNGYKGVNTSTLIVSNAQANRVGNYSVVVSNSVGALQSANATLTLSVNLTLAQALDGPGFTFTVGGTAQPWKAQQTESWDGIDAAESGPGAVSTYTFIKTVVTQPGPVTFRWKVSSEEDHDYLKFMVDGVVQIQISGEVPWQQITYDVPDDGNSHELQWRYSRSPSGTGGQDKAWLDQVYFGNPPPAVTLTPPTILIQPVSQTVDVGDTVELSIATAGSAPMTYRWLRDGTNLVTDGGNVGGATTPALILYNVLPSQAGNYSVIVSNAAGVISSGPARITILPVVDLAEAVDAATLFLTTSGDAPWIGHTTVTHDGTDAGRSSLLTDGQSSTMETMLNGPGTISFWWKVSSETNADTLTFSVNGTPKTSISGEEDWQVVSINLAQGTQHLEWTYRKNGFVAVGADRGWVDQMSFVPTNAPPPVTNAPTSVMAVQLSISSNIVNLTWEASQAKTYKVFYKDDLAEEEWTLLDGEVLVTWKVVDGAIVPDVVIANAQDVLGGPARFYKVLEY